MATFWESVQRKGQDLICTVIDRLNTGAILDSDAVWIDNRNIYRVASRLFCNREPVVPDDPIPPTCPGDDYRIDYTVYSTDLDDFPLTETQTSSFVIVRGPIYGFDWEFENNDNRGPVKLWVEHAVPMQPLMVTRTQMYSAGGTDLGRFRFVIDSIQNLDDPSNSCSNGVLPTLPWSPGDFTFDDNITYTNNDGLDITIPVVAVIAPININLNGELNIPVNFNFDVPFNINPEFNFSFDVDFPIGGGQPRINPQPRNPPPKLPDGVRDIDDPNDFEPITPPPSAPPGTEPPPKEEKPDEPEAVIRAVLVTVTNVSADSRVGLLTQESNPDILVPNAGYINFAIGVGNSSIGWTEDIPVKNRRHFIPCPWIGGAFAVRGTPRDGVTWELTPIYDEV